MAKENRSLEQSFEVLEQVINRMENEELSLEDSFNLYKQGMDLVKECNASIEKVEKKLRVLSEGELNDEE